jgi:hypothetical protein
MDKSNIVRLLHTNDRAVARALVALTERQTADEQTSRNTRYRNGQGFRPCHARLGTSMAQFYERNGYLSGAQLSYWRQPQRDGRTRIEIYANQLLDIARDRAANPVPRPVIPVQARVVDETEFHPVSDQLEQELDQMQSAVYNTDLQTIFASMDTIAPEMAAL